MASITLQERAAVPSTPLTGFWSMYTKSDGLYIVDDAGTETLVGGAPSLLSIGASAVVINEAGADVDFRVESDNDANLIRTDGATDRVGIGTGAPVAKLEVRGTADLTVQRWYANATQTANILEIYDASGDDIIKVAPGGRLTWLPEGSDATPWETFHNSATNHFMYVASATAVAKANLGFRRARGTIASPTINNVSGDDLGVLTFYGYDAGYQLGAQIQVDTNEAWVAGTNRGTRLFIQTIPAASTTLGTMLDINGANIGVFGATPVAQPSGTGETTGFTAGAGTGVNDDSTFTGNVGSTAYRISDIVKHLKNLGWIAT